MISLYKIKPAFQRLLLPLLRIFYRCGVSANQITLASIILSLFIGICFWYADRFHLLFLALPIGLLIRMALNALDGMMARIYDQQSKKGEVLNELGDVLSDLFIFYPLLKYEAHNTYLVIGFLLMSVINEFSGVLAKSVAGQRRYDGPMGKSDRALVVGIYGILCFVQVNMAPYSRWGLLFLIGLIAISTILRLSNSLKS